MTVQRRILILTADVGFGHRKAAAAVQAAMERQSGPETEVLVTVANPLDDARTPSILRDSQVDYDYFVREMPEIYRLQYQFIYSAAPAAVFERLLVVMLYRVMHDLVARHQPDVVLTTHPHYIAPLAALATLGRFRRPFMTVVTDLTRVHRMWFNDAAERIFLPTQEALAEALDYGLPEKLLAVTGIPVSPAFQHLPANRAELREQLGWQPELPTVLVVGSKRVKGLPQVMHALNHANLPVQYVLVAGGDEKLYQRFCQEEWHGPVHLYNYVDRMPLFMAASDCVVTKAGGLILSEALACGLPLLLVDVTPGQEEGNAEYVVRHGAARLASSPLLALEELFHALQHGGLLLNQQAEQARRLGRPGAADEIAAALLAAAECAPQPVPESRLALRPRLRELLSQFGVPLDFI